MDKLAMASLSIFLLYLFYRITIIYPSLSNRFFIYITFALPALGATFRHDFDESPKLRILLRSSTDDSDHGASRDHQLRETKQGLERYNAQVEDKVSVVESANTMDRECLNDFLDDTDSNDDLDGLAVMKIDRLTRAPVFETVEFYNKMKERDLLLYADSIGFIDWDDLNDINQLLHQTVFARKWYLRIQEGTAGSMIEDIKKGKYPLKTPVGFETDGNDKISVKEDERQFVYRTFKTYIREKNRAEVHRQMNEWRQNLGKEPLSKSQYKTLLTSPLAKGHLTYSDQLIEVETGLQMVDENTFRKAQEIRCRREPSETGKQDLPDFLGRAGERYGVDYIISILDSFEPQCRKCGGEVTPSGSAEVLDVSLQGYTCVECNHQGPLLNEAEIQELHQTTSLRCPLCPATERFDVKEVPGFDEYQYTCRVCGGSFKHDSPPDKIERAILYPEAKFEMDRSHDERENSNSNNDSGGNLTEDSETVLSEFC
jgi:DNA invertase Pin-like site-specific DNA recombinase